nr:hypothetical protein [Chromobacterium sp. ASV5]
MNNNSLSFSASEYIRLNDITAASSGTAEDQFIHECINFYREWLETQNIIKDNLPPKTQAILFVFSEAPRIKLGFDEKLVDTPKLVRRKSGTLEQGIVVCNQNFEIMLKVRADLEVDDAYSFVEDNFLDETTFVIAKMGQQKLQIHRSGQHISDWINYPEEHIVKCDDVAVTPDLIAEDISRFHHSNLSTEVSTAARHMWVLDKAKNQYRLGPQPEQHIQSFLLVHLRGSYSRAIVFVNEEIKNQGGRVDICIEREKHPGANKKVNTMLELKVLAPTNTFNENNAWAKKGIDQAKDYRNHDTDVSFACIFDARREKTDMPELTPYASEKNVRLEQYSMRMPADPKPKRTSLRKKTADKSTKRGAA